MAHGTTMLAQGLPLIPRPHLQSLDNMHGPGRPSRILSRWRPFGALVFAQLAGRPSLREVLSALASHAQALAPLGLIPPQRSTVAAANERRPAALSHALLATLYGRCRAVAPGPRFHFKSSPLFPGPPHHLPRLEPVPLGPLAHGSRRQQAASSP